MSIISGYRLGPGRRMLFKEKPDVVLADPSKTGRTFVVVEDCLNSMMAYRVRLVGRLQHAPEIAHSRLNG